MPTYKDLGYDSYIEKKLEDIFQNLNIPISEDNRNFVDRTAEITQANLSSFMNDKVISFDKIDLVIGQGVNSVGMSGTGAESTSIRIWAGDTFTNRSSAPFRVTAAGAVTATSLTITGGDVGGWVITATTLYALSSGTPTVAPNNGIVLTSGATSNIVIYEGTAERLRIGNLSANVFGLRGFATNGTTIIFELSDTRQSIAGWSFTDTTLSATNISITSGAANTANITVGTGATAGGLNSAAVGGDIIFWGGDTFANRATAPFRVTAAGALTSTSGSIGGFIISSTQLTATNFSVTSGVANTARVEVGSGANTGGINSAAAAGDIVFWCGDTFANRATAPFRVTAAGAVTATSVTTMNITTTFQLSSSTVTATAAQLNDLTDTGQLSSQLHFHFFKATLFTRLTGAGTGTQALAHTLGVVPRYIRITAMQDAGGLDLSYSVGAATDTTDEVVQSFGVNTVTDVVQTSGEIIRLHQAGAGTRGRADLSSVDATNVTINWLEAVATATCNMLLEVWG